jgi:hypothetical protein
MNMDEPWHLMDFKQQEKGLKCRKLDVDIC